MSKRKIIKPNEVESHTPLVEFYKDDPKVLKMIETLELTTKVIEAQRKVNEELKEKLFLKEKENKALAERCSDYAVKAAKLKAELHEIKTNPAFRGLR